MQAERFQLWHFLRDLPEAAAPKLRDITPLRLMSWLSYQLSQRTHLLIKEAMDPWEQTGAAPQGWATHLHQTVIPVQGYIQLRPHDTTLPSFGGGPPATAETANEILPTHGDGASSRGHLSVRILVATAEASLAICDRS